MRDTDLVVIDVKIKAFNPPEPRRLYLTVEGIVTVSVHSQRSGTFPHNPSHLSVIFQTVCVVLSA